MSEFSNQIRKKQLRKVDQSCINLAEVTIVVTGAWMPGVFFWDEESECKAIAS